MLNQFEKNVVKKLADRMADYGEADSKEQALIQAKRFYEMVKTCEAEETLEELFK